MLSNYAVDYTSAASRGDAAFRQAVFNGESPYLPVLDSFLDRKGIAGEFPLGTMEIPISMISGNKSISRNNSFANNFMPIMDEKTEFASKWKNLCQSCRREGVRDAIECYEYLNHYYVAEGNKRVSVSKYLDIEYIPATVTRLVPVRTNEKKIQVYYEFMKFHRSTDVFDLVMKEIGEYDRIAECFGETLEQRWSDENRENLKSYWHFFQRIYRKWSHEEDIYVYGPVFLTYITIFSADSLGRDSENQVIANLKTAREELHAEYSLDKIEFLDGPGEPSTSRVRSFFGRRGMKYTTDSPLRFAVVYDSDIEKSRWANAHEAGRLYVDAMFEGKVAGKSYFIRGQEESYDVIQRAIQDGNQVIFTTMPGMANGTQRAAMENPRIRFLNCSLAMNTGSVRCYSGRLYEATYIMGILAASELQKICKEDSQRVIGYLTDYPTYGNLACVNAFAMGAAMIDPRCKVEVRWVSAAADQDYPEKWQEEGVKLICDADYSYHTESNRRIGLYKFDDNGKRVYLGMTYYNWGKYYMQIIQSVINGSYDALNNDRNKAIMNYWYGIGTGVVDVRLGEGIDYQTRRLMEAFKAAIGNGTVSPFDGEIRTQDGMLIHQASSKKTILAEQTERLSDSEIVSMNWLNENIIGKIPVKSELIGYAQRLFSLMGV